MVSLDMDALRMVASGNLAGAREHMDDLVEKQRKQDIKEWIQDNVDLTIHEHYALEDKTVVELLQKVEEDLKEAFAKGWSESPWALLEMHLNDYLEDHYSLFVTKEVDKAAENLAEIFAIEDIDEAKDLIYEYASASFPIEEYLNDKYNTVVVLNTGDADYDFSLNNVDPAWNGTPIEEIDDCASIVWLAQQNGYSKEQLVDLMQNIDEIPEGEHPFIKSLYQEIENTSSSSNSVVFLGTMSLKQIAEAQTQGVTIPKQTTCGLFDGMSGAGGVMEIELQRDIYVPKDMTLSILPDCRDAAFYYCVKETFGFTNKVWQTPLFAGEAKEFTPEQIAQAKALCEKPPRITAEKDTPEAFMQEKFMNAFRLAINAMGGIYDGMLDRGQLIWATESALNRVSYETTGLGKPEYQFSRKHFWDLMKIAPVKLPQNMIDSHMKHFDLIQGRENGR